MELILSKPEIRMEGKEKILICLMSYGDIKYELKYYITDKMEDYVCTSRLDGFLVSVLPWAMLKARRDPNLTVVCEAPVSQILYQKIVNFDIPILSRNIFYYVPIKIDAETDESRLESFDAVGTGVSGGVDSSYTIAKYLNPSKGIRKLTHLVHFNIGIYDGYDSESEKRLEQNVKKIAQKCDLELLIIKTNILKALYGKAHAPVVLNCFYGGILTFQKLFSYYYFSSSISAEYFEFAPEEAGHYDLLSAQCFSNQNVNFFVSGLEVSRLEKVNFISNYDFTYDSLAVCLNEKQNDGNCGKCAKCTRTMVELDVLGKLDFYKNVFDVDDYRKNIKYHWSYIILKSWGGDSYSVEITDYCKKNKKKIPFSFYLASVIKWIKRGFTSKNKKREKIEEIVV